MGRVIPLETVGYYKPDGFIYLSPCGTKIGSYLPCRRRGATTSVRSRGRAIDRRRSGERGTIDRGSTHVCKTVIITVGLDATWPHLMARSRGARTTGDRSRHVL